MANPRLLPDTGFFSKSPKDGIVFVLSLILVHGRLLHLFAAVVRNQSRKITGKRKPFFFIKHRLLTKLFFTLAKDTPFASLTILYPGSDSSLLRSAESFPHVLPLKLDSFPLGLKPKKLCATDSPGVVDSFGNLFPNQRVAISLNDFVKPHFRNNDIYVVISFYKLLNLRIF